MRVHPNELDAKSQRPGGDKVTAENNGAVVALSTPSQ
jgi:hypothetical protein